MNDDLTTALDQLKREGVKVPDAAAQAMRRQLAQFSGVLDANTKKELLQKFLAGLKSIVKPATVLRDGQPVTEGATPASLTSDITKVLAEFESGDKVATMLNLRFKLDVATKVMRGAGHFLNDQADVDEYPAWEFHRIYDRDVPRGLKREGKSLVPVPDEAWDTAAGRWQEALDACSDSDEDKAAMQAIFDGGQMIALKSSDIWNQLGTLRDDSLGNPFAPFAFKSGFGTDGVPYKECVELGLLDDGEQAQPAAFDFTKLFSLPKAA